MKRSMGSTGCEDTAKTDAPLPWNDEDRAALVAMMRLMPKRAEWSQLTKRVAECGRARILWEQDHPGDLFGDNDDAGLLRAAEADVAAWKTAPFDFHTFMDESYPEQLRSVRQMPPVVFTHGRRLSNDIGVCVVGSREASTRALDFARAVAGRLVENGLTVVAGLAKGIDTAAHQAALDAGGRTVAVLGNGLDHVYPRENLRLQQQIAAVGMLLTHFLPDYRPTRYSFPARNVTMSAYGSATIIVEAGEKSGTRIQAREAVAHGRPVILNSIVVQSTAWGNDLKDQPGVYVARSAGEAVDQALMIINRSVVSTVLGLR
ncbi:DNA-processing protein DprA [Nocardia farcinica]|uniref:DNA-processing protein DprA n=1 Tax=Nocardia farcinica TaxID=37329 RepID=UPI0018934306|nr:DNA-processing protein DprA [Nocardia farcinica]MBF6233921.1 DNA-protecting protein DprA [Nocardia farcinica]